MNIYFIKRWILRRFFRLLKITPTDMDMVQYWKTKESVAAKVTKNKDGATIMKLEGEKYDFPGFPRGHLLFGSLSKLKHEIKNQIFNDSWAKLEEEQPKQEIIKEIKKDLHNIFQIAEDSKYDMIPPERMVAPVKEIWRAMTTLERKSLMVEPLKKVLTYILSEDDAYRFRVQWLVQIFNPSSWWFKLFFRNPIKDFEMALMELEDAEIVGDMKDKIKLLRRILMLILEDKNIQSLFKDFCAEMDWNKLKLSPADKFHFRGKWFKVDSLLFEY